MTERKKRRNHVGNPPRVRIYTLAKHRGQDSKLRNIKKMKKRDKIAMVARRRRWTREKRASHSPGSSHLQQALTIGDITVGGETRTKWKD